MQLYIDNWSATLLAPATAAAVSLSVEPAKAALLTGLGSGAFYRLTLVEVDASGTEIDWDVVQVTAVAAGVLTVTRTDTARSWSAGALIEARLTAAGMGELRDTAGGTSVGSATPQALGAAAPGTSLQASRQDHVHPAPTPGDIGAATAAQGAKADSAIQPAGLTAALADKVDKVAGKSLSSNDYTTGEKDKLAGLESSHFKGLHASLAALQTAHPSAVAGDYADVDAGAGVDVVRYLWDVTDSQWVAQAASGGSMTAAQVKTAYESNPDTNAFTDAEQAKLAGIAAGATANADTDSLAEGATNKYFTEGRVRSTVLTGLSLLTGGGISAADSVLSALGKLQKQISDAVTAIGGKQDTLVSGTNLKTVNGNSLLGAGDLAISGSGAVFAPVITKSTTTSTLAITDAGAYLRHTHASASTLTVPPQSSVSWAADTEVHVRRASSGTLTLTPGSGVTLNAPSGGTLVMGNNMSVTLKRVGADVWDVIGQTVAAPGESPHRYWRIFIGATQSNGNDHTIGEIELRAAPGGANLPITAGGVASASLAQYYPASRAFDGLLPRSTNAWVTGGGQTQWVQWDFGAGNAQVVTECKVVNSETASGAELAQHPRNYLVSYSDDGSAWTPCGRKFGASGASEASSTVALDEAFDYSGYSQYRLYISAINGGSNCALAELELIDADAYDVSTGINSNATASSNYSGESPDRAFDNTTGTTWTSANGAGVPHWIAINLVIRAQLHSFALTNQNGLGNRMPRDFILQGSNNGGASWVDVKTVTGETDWANLERRVYMI